MLLWFIYFSSVVLTINKASSNYCLMHTTYANKITVWFCDLFFFHPLCLSISVINEFSNSTCLFFKQNANYIILQFLKVMSYCWSTYCFFLVSFMGICFINTTKCILQMFHNQFFFTSLAILHDSRNFEHIISILGPNDSSGWRPVVKSVVIA